MKSAPILRQGSNEVVLRATLQQVGMFVKPGLGTAT